MGDGGGEDKADEEKARIKKEMELKVFDPIINRLKILPIDLLRIPTCDLIPHIRADHPTIPINNPAMISQLAESYVNQKLGAA